MRHSSRVLVVLALLFAAPAASAQFIAPGTNPNLFPPPLPPPPPPKIVAPTTPMMRGEPESQLPSLPAPRASTRRSFSDRISRCLDEGAAAGLDPADRTAYSRSCATRD
ncbi:hypothetical protein I6F35_22815 [Bradyrhizobium sp. BRP22]|uniref:hypothetical protein n=1 Tax=Bradyrhizobium sp. BRP22 TaxID=2793821 RepID=UPI001CD20D97|nr:hypothetical protein [Bradyrhizobium sp. BRP22]MCA1456003.1 hypothetical protein [Bradyrhizobium sp. BRP22]